MRAPGGKTEKRAAPATLSARLLPRVTLDGRADGKIVAAFDGHSLGLGTYSEDAARRAQELHTGLPFRAFASTRNKLDQEIHQLVRRLAGHGLLEYRLAAPDGADAVVIEPQVPDYWPETPPLDPADTLVLSRFAYLRRRGNDMVLESPRADALFRICDPEIAAALVRLAVPQPVRRLRRTAGSPDLALLALLFGCGMLFKIDPDRGTGLRADEGNDNVVLWDFHDLLFHARSTEGRHANPLGGLYSHTGGMPPLPAVRPRWPGKKIDLRPFSESQPTSQVAKVLRERHSVRGFDDQQPITIAELARFLDATARVQSTWKGGLEEGRDEPVVTYTVRPYPSGGASYELELYLAVDRCEGLARGFYHYDAGGHALVPIAVPPEELKALLMAAEFAMGAPGPPQILVTIAARFGRISWKYSGNAYALILKDVGVLTQTLYLMASDMGLGGCAIGTANIDRFARMTGLDFCAEGAVGQFALGRGGEPVF